MSSARRNIRVVSRTTSAQRDDRGFLPEIQALRAVAVGLVVMFHLWPHRVSGGYVGVDAFFVISGYLITSHLLREVDATGRLRLAAFYARRARRLLPASFTVLLASLVAAALLLPVELRAANAKEILASAFYVQNLYLATKAVTYSASNDVASAVQHFWSLSAEEQFYLVWPSLIIGALLMARRWLRRRTTTTIGLTLVGLTAASFAFSVWFTANNPAAAYFVTPTRAWEFGMGALVVLVMRRWSPPGPFPVLLRWVGVAALVFSGLTYTQATPFPGYAAAVPCLGTAAIIFGGDTGRRDPLTALVQWRPVQWLGDVSYSVYLWHWPLIVFAPYLLGHVTTWRSKLLIVAITLVLAQLSKRYIEDATRFAPALVRSPRLALSAAVAGMLVVAVGTGVELASVQRQEQGVEAAVARGETQPCVGAAAMADRAHCPHAVTADAATPVVKADAPWAAMPGCKGVPGGVDMRRCYWGTGQPTKIVALVGDSHAEHWRRTIQVIAKERNWAVLEAYSNGCPATYGVSVIFERRSRSGDGCRIWTHQVSAQLAELRPSLVITTAYVRMNVFAPKGAGPQGFIDLWREWQKFATVVALSDIPGTGGKHGPQCLSIHVGDPRACSTPRATAMPDDDLRRAARATTATADPVRLVDLSRYFCDSSTCYAVVGGVPVYYDYDHMTNQFATSLAPYLKAQLG
jgi:peptidoglycan/LPS O-acetylase OafA/YrhL